MKPTIAFHTERLVFRTIEPKDAEHVIQVFGDPTTSLLSMIDPPLPFSTAKADEFIEYTKKGRINCWVCLPKSPTEPTIPGEVIGFVNLSSSGPPVATHMNAHFGVTFKPEFTGKGYGPEAMIWLLDMAFLRFNLHKVEGGTWDWNVNARKLYKKMGFREEGLKKEQLWMEGEWCGEVILGITASEWKAWKALNLSDGKLIRNKGTATVLDNAVLTYYELTSRAEPIRYFFEDNGIPYTDEGEGDFEKESMNYEKYPFNQVPKVTLTNGKILVQTMAILQYSATILGKAGSGDLDEDFKVWQLNYAVDDAMVTYRKAVYHVEHVMLLKWFATERVDKVFGQLENLLATKTKETDYFVYDYPSFPEYHLLFLIKSVLVLRPSALENFKLLTRWHETMLGRKGIKEYLESGRQLRGLNGNANADLAIA